MMVIAFAPQKARRRQLPASIGWADERGGRARKERKEERLVREGGKEIRPDRLLPSTMRGGQCEKG